MSRQFVLAAIFCVLAPFRAAAQLPQPPSTGGSTETIDDIRKNYRLHAGPFYLKPAVQLKELGVDTNVFNEAGEQKSDFTFTVTPLADLAVPMARRALFHAKLGTDLVYYHTYDSERSVDPQAIVRLEGYARRITLFAEGSYLNTRQRFSYEIDLRSRHQDNSLTGGVNVRLSPKTSFEVAYRAGRLRFEGDAFFDGTSLKETLDQDTTAVDVAVRYKFSNLTTFAAKFDRTEERFPLSPVRDTDSYRVMPGVEFKPRALISGFAYAGYRSFTPLSGTLPEYSGLVSQVGLTYTLLGATTFGVTANRDVDFLYEELTPYYLDNSYGVFVRRAIGGKWDVVVNATRHRYEYRNLQTQTLVAVPERTDITDNYGANIGYRLKAQTRVGFGAAYYTRSSTTETFREYDGLRIGTTVTYGF